MAWLAISPLPGVRVRLRELRGEDEQVVDGTDTATALALLDRLLFEGGAGRWTTCARDQVLAALCIALFGDRVEATRSCSRCGERFDLDFRLSELAAVVLADVVPGDTFPLEGGVVFRLPTGDDELAAAGDARALLERCLLAGDVARDGQRVMAAMASVGPTLDLDLDGPCTACGAVNEVPFAVQSWLLGLLARDRARLPVQVHRIARAYGWSLAEILSLPRSQRLALVALIEDEARPRARRIAR